MATRKLLTIFGSLMLFSVLDQAVAQNASSTLNGALTPFADSLRSHGIEITQPSLIIALKNADAEIRSLAALKLAEDRDYAAISAIETALSIEKNPRVSVDDALALQTLGDPKGTEHLMGMCEDSSLPIAVVTKVAWHLLNFDSSSVICTNAMLNYLDTNSPDHRDVIVSLLSQIYRHVPQDQSARIVVAIQKLLGNDDVTTRLQAGHALIQIHSSASLEAVQKAISSEQNPAVRSSLQDELNTVHR